MKNYIYGLTIRGGKEKKERARDVKGEYDQDESRVALMGKEGKMKGALAARFSLSERDSELIYSLFPFHLITVAVFLSPFHSLSQFLRVLLVFSKMH